MTIKIHIADDHTVFRAGLRALVEKESDLEVVGETGNSFDTLRAVEHEAPDVLILDINMPGIPTSTLVETVAKEHKDVAVLVLTFHDEEYYLKEFLKSGAKGFMVKTSTGRDLVQAIRTVHQGKRFIDPGLSQYLISSYLGNPTQKKSESAVLTKREQEVLEKLVYGYTNQEVAKVLHISKRTVESHRAAIMSKLNLKSRAELVRHAMQHGLIKNLPAEDNSSPVES